ncbi:MAG: hypothetical protein VXZ40_01180 [Nanoarchaeota archaeon]|nr:hypothetical protein [Nanoarchaeota archaeon]
MKKVLLVLLLFGMIFGGVYGEFNFEIDGVIYTFNDGDSIIIDNEKYFYDSRLEEFYLPSTNGQTGENGNSQFFKFNELDLESSSYQIQISGDVVYSYINSAFNDNLDQTTPTENSNDNFEVDSPRTDTTLSSNSLEYGEKYSLTTIKSGEKSFTYSSELLLSDISDGELNLGNLNLDVNNIRVVEKNNVNNYISFDVGGNRVEIIGMSNNQALTFSMESPSVKTIPTHLQSTLNEYTSSIENLAILKETDEQLYNAIINNGDAQTVNQINNAQKPCSGSSCVNSLETLSNLKENGFDVDSTHYIPHYDAYDSARDEYSQEKARLANCETQECRESSSETLKEKEEELNKQALLMEKYMDSESAYDYVLNKCQVSNDAQKCQSMITAFSDGASCQNSWFPTSLCTFFSDERLVEQSVAQEMQDFKNTITDECKSQSSQKFEDCYNDAYDKKLETSKRNFEVSAWYCPESKTFCSDDDLIKCSSATECKDKEGLTCKSDDYACKLLEEELEEKQRYTDKERYVETSTAFDVIAALMNPDQNALLASELFGFESDFSDLPEWLTEDTASLICLAKIDGYLDTQVESQFEDSAGNSGARGITQYGCSLEDGLEFDPNSGTYQPTVGLPCVEVLADLRAERTPLLPNGDVQITYSYYLKSPPNVNISYMLYTGYHLENQSDLELQPLFLHRNGSLDIQVLEAGEDISDFRVARIPENGTLATPIGDESIKLLLQAFYTDGPSIDEYVSIISPAYPIEVGSYRDPLGQQSSSSSGSDSASGENTDTQEDEQSEGVDDEDIRNNACQLMGTC